MLSTNEEETTVKENPEKDADMGKYGDYGVLIDTQSELTDSLICTVSRIEFGADGMAHILTLHTEDGDRIVAIQDPEEIGRLMALFDMEFGDEYD